MILDRFFDRIRSWWGGANAISMRDRPGGGSTSFKNLLADPPRLYAALDGYYRGNGVYDDISSAMQQAGIWMEAIKPLRNPANRVVEFYAKTLWPGSLPDALEIKAKKDAIIPAIQQVWTWSNWGGQKQVFARRFALYGGMWLKVATDATADQPTATRVFFQLIQPCHVSEYDLDARGVVTFARVNTPTCRRGADGLAIHYTTTEIWTIEGVTIYEHDRPDAAPISELGAPVLTMALADMGITFIPLVYSKFRDLGDDQGAGCFLHALDKIDEVNRMATRLHQMVFRDGKKTIVITAGGLDPSGRPLPAPRIGDQSTDARDGDDVIWKDNQILRLPGNSDVKFLVPNLPYGDFLAIIERMMIELEADLPEMAYYRLSSSNRDLSGRALRYMLAAAIDNALEARGNAEHALQRADAMALSIGQAANLPGFEAVAIGTWQAGDFEHSFDSGDILKPDELEEAQADLAEAQAKVASMEYGMDRYTLLKEEGYTDEEILGPGVEPTPGILPRKEEEEAASANVGSAMLRQYERGTPIGGGQ